MGSYILPQVQVFQHFTQTPTAVQLKNAFIFGPHYQVLRDQVIGAYDKDNDTDYAYPYKVSGSELDATFFKLYMTDVWAQYLHIAESLNNPLVVINNIERNKVRAAPFIDDADVPATTNGVGVESAGYFMGQETLPDNFYFYPVGGWTGAGWEATGFVAALADLAPTVPGYEDAKLAYITSAGLSGTVNLLATDNPLTAGVYMPGPEGIQLDMDPGTRVSAILTFTGQPDALDELTINGTTLVWGTDINVGGDAHESYQNLKDHILTNAVALGVLEVIYIQTTPGTTNGTVRIIGTATSLTTVALDAGYANASVEGVGAYSALRSPLTLTVSDAAATSYFTITPAASKMPAIIDAMVDGTTMTMVPDVGAASEAVSFNTTTLVLTIDIENTVSTLQSLYTALTADSDIAEWFTISDITGTATNDAELVLDETGTAIVGGAVLTAVRDAYRIGVRENDYIFATGNGVTNSTHFKTRGVKVGDRVRWEYIDDTSTIHTGYSKVTGFEADIAAPAIADPTMSADNSATQSGTTLGYKGAGADIVQAGTDNQRDFDGVNTKVYSLDATRTKYIGEYNLGVLDEDLVVTITTGGLANVARASIISVNGTYSRSNVQIIDLGLGANHDGAIYIGRNLWINFQQGAGDADAIFQVGDTYSFSAEVATPYAEIEASDVAKGGAYTGSVDTTYVVEVTRGGVFNRAAVASDGLINASDVTLTCSANISVAADTITIGATVFEFGAATSGYTQVAIAGTLPATLANLVIAINASTEAVRCVSDGVDTVTLYGAAPVLATVVKDSATIGAPVIRTATLSTAVNFTTWTGGDNNDEYILRCTRAGNLTAAEFAIASQRGDDQAGIRFSGSGAAKSVGGQGLNLTFTTAGDPQFSVGDYWVVHVLAARPQVKITDSLGVDQSSYAIADDGVAIPLGVLGATFTFAANTNTAGGFVSGGGLVKDEVFYVEVTAAANGAYRTLVLADDLPATVIFGSTYDGTAYVSDPDPSRFAITLYLVQNQTEISEYKLEAPPAYNWIAGAAEFTVNQDINVQDASWVDGSGDMLYIPVIRGNIMITYRALMTDYADTIYAIEDIGTVEQQLGEISPDNPLSQGVFEALLNSGPRKVNFMAVPTNDLDGYLEVLERAALSETVYGFAPLTQSMTILTAVKGHIDTMSTETEKKWRIGFFGTALPTTRDVYVTATNPLSTPWESTVGADPARPGAGNVLLSITTSDPGAVTSVNAGDRVRLNFSTDPWGNETYEEYEVLSNPTTNSTIKLVTGPALPINVAQKFELYHDRSTAEIAEAVAAITTGFGSRRIMHIFPSDGYADGVLLPSQYGAAQAAALCCSVPAQQGLTNIEINGYTDLPMVYRTFTKDQLNTMAAAGTMIIMQAASGSRIYIRHQLTTAAADGNLNTSELSMTKNLDSVSYYFVNVLSPYIGIYNVTPELVEVIKTQIEQGISYLTSYTDIGLLGPQLIAEGTAIESIQQHPIYKDHILCVMNAHLPPPFNVMQLHIVV